ncbi:MAG: MFS transporter [Rhodospirillaceae bacterium]
MARSATTRLAVLVIAGEIFSLIGFASFAVVLPELSGLWQLNAAAAGWISGAYQGGYVLAVPFLVGITDRVSSRRVYLVSCLVGAIAAAGFAWGAGGALSACLYRALAGASLAGTFMPGLRLLTERLTGGTRLRIVPYYTASFGIGVSVSFVICGWLAHRLGWPAAFLVGAGGSLAAAALVLAATAGWPPAAAPPPAPTAGHPINPGPVLGNRGVMVYVIAYGGHCWELFALRAWMLPLLVFACGRAGDGAPGDAVAWWTSAIVLTGVPASILGAEAALAFGRRRLIGWAAWGSVGCGLVLGLVAGWSLWLVILVMTAYNIAVTADSGALTTGVIVHAAPGQQGASLAVHSVVGFTGGALGPVAVGLLLDLGGGAGEPLAWALALAAMAAGSLVTALAVGRFRD